MLKLNILKILKRGGGRAYIDTGYIPTENDNDFHLKFSYIGSEGDVGLWAGTNETGQNGYRIASRGNNIFFFGGSSSYGQEKIPEEQIGKEYINNISVYRNFTYDYNGTIGQIPNNTSAQNTGNVFLFRRKDLYQTYGRIYSFKWIKGDETILDLIPVRKDSIGYMYNKVDGKLYGNSGEGKFILGPDV